MQLLGAREFIKMPPGTFYISYWMNTTQECLQIIQQFQDDVQSLVNESWDSLEVFGDNYGSMSFCGDKEDNYIFYYDANVVGDASPDTTLYLVMGENELPNAISVQNNNGDTHCISKSEIISIKNIFLNEMKNPSYSEWAIEHLNDLSKRGNSIVNTRINKEI